MEKRSTTTKFHRLKNIMKLVSDGKIDNASKLFEDGDKELLLDIGMKLGQQDDHEFSRRIFHTLVQLYPDYAEAWYNEGVALDELGRHNEAVECYDRAIRINPNFAEAWYNKGVTCKELGNGDEALRCFNRADEIVSHLSQKKEKG